MHKRTKLLSIAAGFWVAVAVAACGSSDTSSTDEGTPPAPTGTTQPDGGAKSDTGTKPSACTPESDEAFCKRLQKSCGVVSGVDNCNANRDISCGNCATAQKCSTDNVCVTATPPPPDGGPGDATPDVVTPPADASSDAKADAVSDASVEAAADAKADVVSDAGAEAAADVAVDAPPDVSVDASDAAVDATADAAIDAAADTGSDAAAAPLGTRIVTGDVRILALTTDEQVLYVDNASDTLNAVPVAGGAPTQLATTASQLSTLVDGRVLFMWRSVSATTQLGTLSYWRAGLSGVQTVGAGSVYGIAAASADGTYVVYSTNGGLGVADLVGRTAAATSTTGLVTAFGISTASTATSTVYFVPSSTRAFVATCSTSARTATIRTFDAAASWAANTIATGADPSSVTTDDAGQQIFALFPTGTTTPARVYSVPAGTLTAIDSNAYGGWVIPDGTAVIYAKDTGSAFDLWRRPLPTGTSTRFATNVYAALDWTSNYSQVAYATNADSMGRSDVRLQSTVAPSSSASFVTSLTGAAGLPWGPGFTTNDEYLIYFDPVEATRALTGTLKFASVVGGVSYLIGTNVWDERVAGGSKVAFAANHDMTSGRHDLRVVNMANSATTTLVATQADFRYRAARNSGRLVFTMSTATAVQGLWSYAIP